MKTCLIGGNGFIGSVVARQLIADGHEVRCTLRKTSKTERIDGLKLERVEGDVRDLASLEAAFEGCEAVIHLASPSAWADINSAQLESTVKTGTGNVLAAAKKTGAKVVFCSSTIAIDCSDTPQVFDETSAFTIVDPKLRYAHCKHAAEEQCKEAAADGQHVVIVNPGEVYGPNDTGFITSGNLVDFAKSSPVLVSKGGTGIVFVDDVALGIVRAMERGRSCERYILAGPNLTIRELAELTLKLLGQKKRIVTMPTGVLRALTSGATAMKIPLPYIPEVIPYATRYWFMSNRKATEELGVRFRSAEEILGPTLTWLKDAGHIKVS